MNFVIYHSCLRAFLELPDQMWAEYEATGGDMKWTSDFVRIPEEFGVNNVYGEIGTTFANSAVAHPRFSAAFIGSLVKGLGADHVVWGTDTVWYGSPQWQIEAHAPARSARGHAGEIRAAVARAGPTASPSRRSSASTRRASTA